MKGAAALDPVRRSKDHSGARTAASRNRSNAAGAFRESSSDTVRESTQRTFAVAFPATTRPPHPPTVMTVARSRSAYQRASVPRDMDESAERTRVEWHEWGPEPFEIADRAGKPVLLSLSATWCSWCHEMDEETYSEPRIAANVNDGFVPVRVDVDRHPRVRERYNMGGFPSTVFLTPSGDILTGATLLGVDGFRGILDSVRETWDTKGEDAGSKPRAVRDDVPPSGPITDRIEEHMIEQLLGSYDDEFGGWGTD